MAEEQNKVEQGASILSAEAGETVSKAVDGIARGDFSMAWPLVENYIIPSALSILLLIVAYFVGKFLSKSLSAPVSKRVDVTLGRFVQKLIFYSVITFAVLGVLGRLGISVASFTAVIAAAGFAIGLAFQGTLSNFAAGILLLVFRPFKVGDVVSAANISGKVYEIELFTTTFDTFDNRRLIVPNSLVSKDTIENVTYHSHRRIDVEVGVAYAADIDTVRGALEGAVRSLEDVMIQGEARGSQVLMSSLGDSSVGWTVRFWSLTADYGANREKLLIAIKRSLDEAGVSIPFPQMDVHLFKEA